MPANPLPLGEGGLLERQSARAAEAKAMVFLALYALGGGAGVWQAGLGVAGSAGGKGVGGGGCGGGRPRRDVALDSNVLSLLGGVS